MILISHILICWYELTKSPKTFLCASTNRGSKLFEQFTKKNQLVVDKLVRFSLLQSSDLQELPELLVHASRA